MLKKANRISSRKEFERVKREGSLMNGNWWSVLVANSGDKEKKVGIVISKKISKKAVERNRARRLIAEGVRRNLELVPEGDRIVFLVKKAILGRGAGEIEQGIKNQISKIKT